MAPSLSYSSFVGSSKLGREVKQATSRQGTHRSAGRFVTVARNYATHLYCDGSCRQPNGVSGVGIVMDYNKGRFERHASKRLSGQNYGPAEVDYEAVLYGLRCCQAYLKKNSVLVMTDQQSVITTLNNRTSSGNDRIAGLIRKILSVAGIFPRVAFQQIPREENQAANKLARDASGSNREEYDFEKNKSELFEYEY